MFVSLGFVAGCGSADLAPLGVEGPGAVALSEVALDLGTARAGTVALRTLEVRSLGPGPVTLTELRVDADGGAFEAESRFSSLAAGETGQVEVRYGPCADVADPCDCSGRLDTGTLELTFDDVEAPGPVELRGVTAALGPDLVTDPADVLDFVEVAPGAPRTATLILRNEGCTPLDIDTLDVTAPGGVGETNARDEFRIRDCDWPCDPSASLCGRADPSCSTLELAIDYANIDAVTDDLAELEVRAVRTDVPATNVVLRALTADCPPPSGSTNVRGPNTPCANQPVFVDFDAASPLSIAQVQWSWLFARQPIPELEPSRTSTTVRFVPERPGLYILGAEISNACGAVLAVTTQINVGSTCR